MKKKVIALIVIFLVLIGMLFFYEQQSKKTLENCQDASCITRIAEKYNNPNLCNEIKNLEGSSEQEIENCKEIVSSSNQIPSNSPENSGGNTGNFQPTSPEYPEAKTEIEQCNEEIKKGLKDTCFEYHNPIIQGNECQEEKNLICTSLFKETLTDEEKRYLCSSLVHKGMKAYCLKEVLKEDCRDFAAGNPYLVSICQFNSSLQNYLEFIPRSTNEF